jgi:preprotein translocase subunit SecD
MKRRWLKIAGLTVFVLFSFITASPSIVREKLKINWPYPIKLNLGLDLQGGSRIVYEADISKFEGAEKERAMESLRTVIDRRVNALGVTEPNIYTTKIGDSRRLAIELPGVDIDSAKEIIGATSKLEFKVPMEDMSDWEETGLEGKHLRRATITQDQQTRAWQVGLQFNSEGSKLFSELTEKYLGSSIGIFLDGELVSAPTVQSKITDGNAVITGQFTLEEANRLKINLNAGALPVDIKLVEERTVGASLGQESVRKSLFAGVIALVFVLAYMIVYYRLLGVIASMALLIYVTTLLSIFKGGFWLFPPVTLTLAGIAAFILSIGMAVDANILIFERMKEEFRNGKTYGAAVENGFNKAWIPIKDSNTSTIIICIILILFGSTSIKGFAYTLILGVGASLFSTMVITRTILRAFVNTKITKKTRSFGLVKKVEV